MNAWAIDAYGEPDHFRRQTTPRPKPVASEVLIRVMATSVNPIDCKIRRGERPAIAPALPAILHGDVAGIVEELGEGVTDFALGDEVYGMVGGVKDLGGSLADFTKADTQLLARKPTNLSFAEAAALPLVTITAWEGIHDRARVEAGQQVLVHAGTGGVGHIAAQLALAAGAQTTVTISSEKKAQTVHKLCGDAIKTVNYREESVSDYVERITNGRGFDVVFDSVGGENLANSFAATRQNGQVVNILAMTEHDLTPMHLKGLSLHVIFMLLPLLTGIGRARHGAILASATELAEAGKLKPLIDSTHTFDQAGDAHRRAERGQQEGKIVLTHPEHL